MIRKFLVDGQQIPVPEGTWEVIVELEPGEIKDLELAPEAQLHFRFTDEGEIREFVDHQNVLDIDANTYEELIESLGEE